MDLRLYFRHLFKNIHYLIVLFGFLIPTCYAIQAMAPVSGFARSFLLGSNISGATITVLETGQRFQTDLNGHFGPFAYPVGKPITLQLEKWNYKTTQSATVIVPIEGLNSPYNNITFQVPSVETYYLLATIVGAKIDSESCHVAATITAYHKTMDDIPQGESDATISLTPSILSNVFYFDIFKSGPLKGKTNPFTRDLTATTEDGGVLIFNLPPRDELYSLSADKNQVSFNRIYFRCRKGAFINISPPQGPMAQA